MHTVLSSIRTLCAAGDCPYWSRCSASPAPRNGQTPPFEPVLVATASIDGLVSVICLSKPESN